MRQLTDADIRTITDRMNAIPPQAPRLAHPRRGLRTEDDRDRSPTALPSTHRKVALQVALTAQPSLNLRSETVQAELRRIMAFWRDRGVDGFRMDAITSFLFDPELRDNPPASPEVRDKVFGPNAVPYSYQDHVHDILPGDGIPLVEKVRAWAGEDVFLIGEVSSGNQSVELACQLSEPGRLDCA